MRTVIVTALAAIALAGCTTAAAPHPSSSPFATSNPVMNPRLAMAPSQCQPWALTGAPGHLLRHHRPC